MSTLQLNPYFVIPPHVRKQYECLQGLEPPIVCVYRESRYLKLEVAELREVQEIALTIIQEVAKNFVALLHMKLSFPGEGPIPIDASHFIRSQVQKGIREIEEKKQGKSAKLREFYDKKIALIKESENFFVSFFEEHAVFHSTQTEEDAKQWVKDVKPLLYKAVFYEDPKSGKWGDPIPQEVFSENKEQRLRIYHALKEEGFRSVQYPDTEDRVWYAAGKASLIGVVLENGKIQSELGEHDLFEIPLEYGREAIFFRKSHATLYS